MRPVRFNIFGSVISVLILSIGASGLTMMGAPVWVPQVFNALALLFALIFSRWLSVGIARRRPTRARPIGKPAQP
jgi:ribose transport system permease protein